MTVHFPDQLMCNALVLLLTGSCLYPYLSVFPFLRLFSEALEALGAMTFLQESAQVVHNYIKTLELNVQPH